MLLRRWSRSTSLWRHSRTLAQASVLYLANLRAHNPKVAGSNPAPATGKGPGNGAFGLLMAVPSVETFAQLWPTRRRIAAQPWISASSERHWLSRPSLASADGGVSPGSVCRAVASAVGAEQSLLRRCSRGCDQGGRPTWAGVPAPGFRRDVPVFRLNATAVIAIFTVESASAGLPWWPMPTPGGRRRRSMRALSCLAW
jgi:hypothetical protein